MNPGIPIVIGERFRLVSYGRGLSYAIQRLDAAEWRGVLFVTGDDASEFHETWQAHEVRWPDELNDVLLSRMASHHYDLDLATAPAD